MQLNVLSNIYYNDTFNINKLIESETNLLLCKLKSIVFLNYIVIIILCVYVITLLILERGR